MGNKVGAACDKLLLLCHFLRVGVVPAMSHCDVGGLTRASDRGKRLVLVR